jgi:hypothetical protein
MTCKIDSKVLSNAVATANHYFFLYCAVLRRLFQRRAFLTALP